MSAHAHAGRTTPFRMLQLQKPKSRHWTPTVKLCSALEKKNIDTIWDTVAAFRDAMAPSGAAQARRARQSTEWVWSQVQQQLMGLARADANGVMRGIEGGMEGRLVHGHVTPRHVARRMVQAFLDTDGATARPAGEEGPRAAADGTFRYR
jgi:LAO/AO transport system kinase